MHIGDTIIRLDSVESTNRYIKDRSAELSSGTVVFTKDQTGGRGRGDKKWISLRDKSLTFSILLVFENQKISMPFFHLFPAVAIVSCLRRFHVNARIKWPNDIYLNGSKIGGLLVQAISRPERTDVILGIGLNVLQDKADFSRDLQNIAASIWSLTGKKIEIDILFHAILDEIKKVYEQFYHPAQWPSLQKKWCEFCAHLDQEITIFFQQKSYTGTFIGLDENGFALLEKNGQTIIVHDYEYVSLRETNDTRN